MADTTAIEWCDSTFNPWIGCTKVSPGCDHCYAERDFDKRRHVVVWGPGQARHRTARLTWRKPLQWQAGAAAFQAQHSRRQRVFCASLADWLDNEVLTTWRCDLLALIQSTPDLDWLLLTKRIGNWRALLQEVTAMASLDPGRRIWPGLAEWTADWLDGKAPANVWLGATVFNQAEADRDVPKLLAAPARVRFLSIEPMLGPIELGLQCENWSDDIVMDPETGARECCKACDYTGIGNAIDWVICGGESGPKARPMHPDWARSLRDQCEAAGAPFLFKQWGEWAEVDGDKPTRTVQVESDIGETLAGRCDGFISHAGEFVSSMDDATTDDPYRGLRRSGKKAAGRLLDGRTHDEVPSP